jgi:hypothetical protein
MKLDPYREYREPPRAPDANWNRALDTEMSDAATLSAYDHQGARNRPGGVAKPRPRFATDKLLSIHRT